MRSSLSLVIALLCAGCGSSSVKVGGDDTSVSDSGGGNGGGGDDTAVIDDTAPPAPVSYAGSVDGLMHFTSSGGGGGGGGQGGGEPPPDMPCAGTATFTVTPEGALSGTASCSINTPQGTQTLEGDLTGTSTSGAVSATWTLPMGPESVVVPFTGTVTGVQVRLDGSVDIPNAGTFSASISADAS